MKKKVLAVMVAVIVITSSVTGGTMAVYQASTKTDKTISTSSLDVKLNIEGNVDDQGNVIFTPEDITGGRVSQRVSAINSGTKNQYVRVHVNKAWHDGQKKVHERDGRDISNEYIGISTCNAQDWLIVNNEDNGEDTYIYYKKILKAGETTSDFMDAFTIFDDQFENTNAYSGLLVKIRFDADAVQTVAASEAMLAEWGVMATMDDEGNIVSLINQ